MNRLIDISNKADILPEYRETPIELLLEYHNLGREPDNYEAAELLIGMCIDNREQLHIPDKFAYIIRAGGANLEYSEFNISYAIAVGGIQHLSIIGHNNCGMSNLDRYKDQFIKGLVDNGGWTEKEAADHFTHFAPRFEIGDEIDFVVEEAKQLLKRYPKVCVAPMLFNVNDSRLYLLNEK